MSVFELAILSKLSKSYISQVKQGKRLPSARLLRILQQDTGNGNGRREADIETYFRLFIKSRREGISKNTIKFHRQYLGKLYLVWVYLPNQSGLIPFWLPYPVLWGETRLFQGAGSIL